MDVVFNLINVKRFFTYSYEEKVELKGNGRPLPDIFIEKSSETRGKRYTRKLNKDIYLKNEWICGCNKKNALYCFPCLLFGGIKSWTETGVTDLEHLSTRIKRHENSKIHLHNCMEFAFLGITNIFAQLDSAYWINMQRHNENVSKNRYVLSKIINCIKFCGIFELALRGHDESDTSENQGIFSELINFSAELDATLSEHLNNSSIFKGTSKEILNDLLQCMLEVCHEQIIEEINNSSFLAIIADETMDLAEKSQLAVIFRYVRDGEPIERFWNYLTSDKCDAETLSKTILTVIDPLIQNSPNKLIAQSYDGAAVMSNQHAGVQTLIKKKYPFAHYVHCYAHQLNLIISKAASTNKQVHAFFGNLQDIPAFFNHSPQRIEVLNKIVNRRIPHVTTTRWNFNITTMDVVYENRNPLIKCMDEMEEQFSNNTACSAAATIRRTLNDPIFNFWLTFFHYVMPHVDILLSQLQQRKIEPTQVTVAIDNFESSIIQVRNNIDNIISEASDIIGHEPPENKRNRPCNSKFDHRISALEVCDVIINCTKDRFNFKEHLVVESLFFSEYFGEYCGKFPEKQLTSVCSFYPTLDKERLQTELSVIYSRNDCRTLNGTLPLLKFLIANNLGNTLKETKKLLEIVVTTPMTTSEAERCFSTLNRIKTFLRNSMTEDSMTALSMLSIEKKFISEIDNFNDKVITKFANRKDCRMDFIYKKKEMFGQSYSQPLTRIEDMIDIEEEEICNLPETHAERSYFENDVKTETDADDNAFIDCKVDVVEHSFDIKNELEPERPQSPEVFLAEMRLKNVDDKASSQADVPDTHSTVEKLLMANPGLSIPDEIMNCHIDPAIELFDFVKQFEKTMVSKEFVTSNLELVSSQNIILNNLNTGLVRVEKSDNIYICNTCNQLFTSRAKFNLHKKHHFICDVCYTNCSNKALLDKHMHEFHPLIPKNNGNMKITLQKNDVCTALNTKSKPAENNDSAEDVETDHVKHLLVSRFMHKTQQGTQTNYAEQLQEPVTELNTIQFRGIVRDLETSKIPVQFKISQTGLMGRFVHSEENRPELNTQSYNFSHITPIAVVPVSDESLVVDLANSPISNNDKSPRRKRSRTQSCDARTFNVQTVINSDSDSDNENTSSHQSVDCF